MAAVGILDHIKGLLRRDSIPDFKTRDEYFTWKAQQAAAGKVSSAPPPAGVPPPAQRSAARPASKSEWKLGPSICPYCGETFERFPSRKRKCPACENVVVIWRDREHNERRLVTEARASALETEEAARLRAEVEAAAPGAFVRRVRRQIDHGDLTDAEILGHLEKATNEGEATWTLYQVAMLREMKRSDFAAMSDLYHSMALFLDKEGRDFHGVLKEAYICNLRALEREALESDGLIKGVEIAGGACEACQRLEGRRFTFAEALRANPLPCKACSTHMYSARPGFCRCMYLHWMR